MRIGVIRATTRVIATLWVLSACPFVAPAQSSAEPIRLDSRNPHYFQYGGKAIALVTSGEHYGSVINADFDYKTYLKTLHADGLNYTRLFGGSYVEVPKTSFGIQRNTLAPEAGQLILPWARSAEPGYAGGGNKFDLETWDPEYFKRLHDFLTEAERRGVIVEISLFSSQYGDLQWKVSPFHPENNVNHTSADRSTVNTLNNGNLLAFQERYVRKLVHEAARHPNVLFELQNEPWSDHGVLADVVNPYLFPPGRDQYPNSIELADEASIEWETRVAEWIASEETTLPHKHLIAQNYSNFRLPVRALIAGVSVVNFHYAYPSAVAMNYGLGKAIAYDETGFLGHGDDAYRRQAWNFMLAGGSAFDGLDYSFTTAHPDGTDLAPNGPGGGSPTLRHQLGVLQKFLAGLPLADMTPDERLVIHADGVNVNALSNSRGVYAVYLDGKGPSALSLRLPVGSYRATWVDPVTGAQTTVDSLRSDGGSTMLRTPDFSQDIALRLELEVH